MVHPLLSFTSRLANRSSSASGAVLDVLAPAVYATSTPSNRNHSSLSNSRPSRPPSSSTRSPGPSTASQPRPAKAPSSSTPSLRKPRRRPPTLETQPSAVDLLSQIRNSAPPAPPNPHRDTTSDPHNLAVLSLTRAVRSSPPNYAHAFQQGWLPLRRKGMAGRLRPEDVAKLLPALTAITVENPDRVHIDWKHWRELVLWLSGEGQDARAAVAKWAWETVALGPVGCERVAEVFDALGRGEHAVLRASDKAPDFAYKRPFELGSGKQAVELGAEGKAPKEEERSMTAGFVAAAVAAKTVLLASPSSPSSSSSAAQPTFASALPSFLPRSIPRLSTFLDHANSAKQLKQHLSGLSLPSHRDPLALVSSALRQVSLAQTWYAHPAGAGIGIIDAASQLLRNGDTARAWVMWQAIQEGVESDEVRWIETDGWDAGAKQRWMYPGMREELEQLERRELRDERLAEDPAAVVPPAEDAAPEPTPAPSAPPSYPPASLHQAIVAKFLSGFAYSRQFTHAESIWNWLLARSLTPGVVAWTGLLNGYARRGDVVATEQVFADIKASGVEPDLWPWLDRITAHYEAKLPDEAARLAEQMKRDPAVLRYLAKKYGGQLPEAAYNALIVGLLSNGRRVEAEAVLQEMDAAGVKPSTYTINGFIRQYTRGSKPDLAATARLLRLVTERGLEANVYTFTMVLMALLQVGQEDATAKTLEVMAASNVKPTVTTYGAIIAHLARSGEAQHLTAAVQLLDEMESKKLATNRIVYTALLQGFLRGIATTPAAAVAPALASFPATFPGPTGVDVGPGPFTPLHPYLEGALTLKRRMERRGITLNRVGYNALIAAALDLQSETGVRLALRLFREMQRKLAAASSSSSKEGEDGGEVEDGRQVTVADTWYVLLSGFARMHDWARCHAVVQEMRANKFEVRSKGLARLVQYVTRREF
ncbi:hypothetical protein JCM10207_008140 [Rhodosporidiobolus poonsookiae]